MTLKLTTSIVVLCIAISGLGAVIVEDIDALGALVSNTAAYIHAAGYPSETHQVVTEDGYILQMHRIPRGPNSDPGRARTPVFIMHGLTATSSAYIAVGANLSIAYNVVDAGFDVWLGNARGTVNGRSHSKLNPDNNRHASDFFDFSFEEIGMYDIPAMIDYVLDHTKNQKLHYIGHSQGCSTFLVMTSMLPEYNEKIITAHLLAPVGYMKYFPDRSLSLMARTTNMLYSMAQSSGIYEISGGGGGPVAARSESVLADWMPIPTSALDCDHASGDMAATCGVVGRDGSRNSIASAFIGGGGGASVKQFAHFGQNIRDKKFKRFDYGLLKNLAKYGSTREPAYDLGKITVEATLHYTVGDNLLHERDVLAMAADMPNARVRRIARDDFTHNDFIIAADAKELVNDYVVKALLSA
ncbi:hypothetical protein JYU34_006647 [Plutella xylostella]|uniref:Lipase n=1 Tax=Plutella xylostella TaxID=51655 RepID=A0ABQ7QSG3_PLUXY|nr:hypothetical protein JYU34_006647 [Plutella xylostella]